MKKIILIILSLLCLSILGCVKEIDEGELKQFVIEYDDALSKGWSESDEIFEPSVTKKYLAEDAFLDHCSNNDWYVYDDDIEILDVVKLPKEKYKYYGKNSYKITYRQNIIGEIINNKIVPNYISDETNVFVVVRNNKLYVTGYPYLCCCVKEKHLPALIKRKGLVYAK